MKVKRRKKMKLKHLKHKIMKNPIKKCKVNYFIFLFLILARVLRFEEKKTYYYRTFF